MFYYVSCNLLSGKRYLIVVFVSDVSDGNTNPEVITRTYSITDAATNSINVTQSITINDTTAPVADTVTLSDVTAECEVTNLVAPTATDNCGGAVTVTNNATLPITTQGTTIITWTYDDGNGNTSTQTQNVVIDDITAPLADNTTLSDVTAECEVTNLVAPTATDNCGGTVTVTNNATLPITTQGTTVVTWTYDDGNGNTSTQDQNVVINDSTAPVADTITLSDVTAECEVTNLVAPTATDNCGGAVTVTNNATLPITTQGTTVVTWTYDDGNGNTSTQTQNVVIDDITAPLADNTTLSDVTAECEVTNLVTPTATDNCGGAVTVTNNATLPISSQGTTVVTWTYYDGNGNISTQDENVIIDDITAPVADLVNLADVTGQCSVTSLSSPSATDNCSAVVTVTNDASLPIRTIGTTVVTWTYNDGNGNTSTQTQNVIVTESDIVNATLMSDTVTFDGTAHSLSVTNIPASATIVYSGNNQTNAGVYTVTATVTSANALCDPIVLSGTLTIERAPQTITFDALAPRRLFVDPDFQLTATSSSGLPVNYSVSSPSATPAANVSNTGFVALQAEGEIQISAMQAGNANYLPAASVAQTLEVLLADNADLDAITINGDVINNPGNTINYVIDCLDSNSSIDIVLENTERATFSPGETFSMAIPRPGIYSQEIVITSEDGRVQENYTLIVEKRFTFNEIVEQKFNNTLVVNNNPANNGGYNFVSYEWFKNGSPVSSRQFFSEGNNASDLLDPNALYTVRMTTAEGVTLQTCESTITLGNSFSLKILENPIIKGNDIKVEADYPLTELTDAVFYIYTQDGKLIDTLPVQGNLSNLKLTLSSGYYSLILVTSQRKVSTNFIKN